MSAKVHHYPKVTQTLWRALAEDDLSAILPLLDRMEEDGHGGSASRIKTVICILVHEMSWRAYDGRNLLWLIDKLELGDVFDFRDRIERMAHRRTRG